MTGPSVFCPDDCRGQHSVTFGPTSRSDAILNPKPSNDCSYDDLVTAHKETVTIEEKPYYNVMNCCNQPPTP
jgi:hypothetical protein